MHLQLVFSVNFVDFSATNEEDRFIRSATSIRLGRFIYGKYTQVHMDLKNNEVSF